MYMYGEYAVEIGVLNIPCYEIYYERYGDQNIFKVSSSWFHFIHFRNINVSQRFRKYIASPTWVTADATRNATIATVTI